MKLIIASASPRRKMLLQNLGFQTSVIKPVFDESKVELESPEKYVMALAEGKMDSIDTKGTLALSADTVVAIGDKVLGKPETEKAAYDMLSKLSANTHSVYTGVCITYKQKKSVFYSKSDVTFYPLTDSQIKNYISTGAPFDKAGAYGLQDENGICFIKEVSGEISNVIGLPLGRVLEEIERIIK